MNGSSVLPQVTPTRAITGEEIARYRTDGVVHLPGIIDPDWASLLGRGIDELVAQQTSHTLDLTAVGLIADGESVDAAATGETLSDSDTEWAIAQQLGDTVLRDTRVDAPLNERGRFISVHQIGWKLNDKIRAVIMDSPCPEIAATLMHSARVNFYQEQVLVKPPLTAEKTAWHQDQGYDHCRGEQVCAVRVVCDPENLETGTVQYLRGSHLNGTVYKVNLFVSDQVHPEDPGSELPDIDGHESDYDLIHFEPKPGDVIVHHLRSVHGAGANRSATQQRRAITIRYTGDDAVYQRREFAPPDGIMIERVDGRPFDDYPDEHPRVWPRT